MASSSVEQQLEEVVENIVATDYTLVVVTTMVAYDYLLQFPLEIEFIWKKKFSSTTLAYMTLRYLGLVYAVAQILSYFSIPLSNNSCFALYVIDNIGAMVIFFVLQGMIAIRVYILLGRQKKILFVLAIFFVVSQGVDIALSAILLKYAVSSTAEIYFVGFYACTTGVVTTIQWLYPTSSGILIAYEVIICGFAVRYAIKNLGPFAWKNAISSLNTLMAMIVQDNIIYFFIVFLQALVNGLAVLSKLASIPLSCLDGALQTVVLTMVGPWMIINLRRNYERDLNGDASESHELTPVAFVTPEFDSNPDVDAEA